MAGQSPLWGWRTNAYCADADPCACFYSQNKNNTYICIAKGEDSSFHLPLCGRFRHGFSVRFVFYTGILTRYFCGARRQVGVGATTGCVLHRFCKGYFVGNFLLQSDAFCLFTAFFSAFVRFFAIWYGTSFFAFLGKRELSGVLCRKCSCSWRSKIAGCLLAVVVFTESGNSLSQSVACRICNPCQPRIVSKRFSGWRASGPLECCCAAVSGSVFDRDVLFVFIQYCFQWRLHPRQPSFVVTILECTVAWRGERTAPRRGVAAD